MTEKGKYERIKGFKMPKGTVCFHIPTRNDTPKQISDEAYLKIVGKKGYFCGYIQGNAICFVKGESVIVVFKRQLDLIEKFGGWLV